MTELEKILMRIERRCRALGITPSRAAILSGKPNAVANIRRAIKQRGPDAGVSTSTITVLAAPLRTTPEWLLTGQGPEEPLEYHTAVSKSDMDGNITDNYDEGVDEGPIPRIAPVVGVVQAGIWTEFQDFEDEAFDGAKVPVAPCPWEHLPQTSYFVRGDSMDLANIRSGTYVIGVPYFDARSDIRHGDIVVVERKRGASVERTVKEIQVRDGHVLLVPRSSNPRYAPITVRLDRMEEDDGTEVRLISLLVGTFAPLNQST